MHAVVALALPTVEAFDLAIPSQVFGDQVIHAEQYTFTVCAPSAGLVPSTAGYAIQAERDLDALADADTVVVPGYLPLDDPGEVVCSALREAAARGARVVSICTGAFALAAAGLLDHRQATTHWQYADDLSARFPSVKVDPNVLWDVWLGQAPERGYNEILCRKGLPNDYPFNPGWRDYREYSGGR